MCSGVLVVRPLLYVAAPKMNGGPSSCDVNTLTTHSFVALLACVLNAPRTFPPSRRHPIKSDLHAPYLGRNIFTANTYLLLFNDRSTHQLPSTTFDQNSAPTLPLYPIVIHILRT